MIPRTSRIPCAMLQHRVPQSRPTLRQCRVPVIPSSRASKPVVTFTPRRRDNDDIATNFVNAYFINFFAHKNAYTTTPFHEPQSHHQHQPSTVSDDAAPIIDSGSFSIDCSSCGE